MIDKKNCTKTIGLIGYGNFGKLIASHLKEFFDIYVYDTHSLVPNDIESSTLENALKQDIIILAIPYTGFKNFIEQNAHLIAPNTLVIDVLSIKVKAIDLLEKHLHKDVEIFATHPLFGPESTKDGLKDKKIAIFPIRTTQEKEITNFLTQKLHLKIIKTTAKEHDKQMAYIQALSHFVSKALVKFDLPVYEDQQTKTYEYLQSAKNIVKNDSDELFYTIQNENPFAYDVREDFLKTLEEIHKNINEH
ncbi:MAG: Prephenate dehydrogenase [uncultured Campylobacterales bacterium]|uniref:Prephenate dehydrogenase n=1 Tax=uncultured Campylobacterales bacterium TaxID=352960 RepID=A0A6S6SJ63_9BACT|nr:MAG: Prephenate dehydrogenase [uncultured Campylobacterales bacterium]